jgi:hypothetical protein
LDSLGDGIAGDTTGGIGVDGRAGCGSASRDSSLVEAAASKAVRLTPNMITITAMRLIVFPRWWVSRGKREQGSKGSSGDKTEHSGSVDQQAASRSQTTLLVAEMDDLPMFSGEGEDTGE